MRLTAEDLADCRYVDTNGNVLNPAITPCVLMPDPKVRETDMLHAVSGFQEPDDSLIGLVVSHPRTSPNTQATESTHD